MRFFLLVTCCTLGLLGRAQGPFTAGTFASALQKAKTEGKMVFLQYDADDCNDCNEVADKAFSDKQLSERLAATFICLRIDRHHPDRALVGRLYHMNGKFGSLFLDDNKNLIYNFQRTSSLPREYNLAIDAALGKAGETLQLHELEKEYGKGNRSPGFLEMLLVKKRSLALPIDSLLDEYVSLLPPDSLRSQRVLQFIAGMAPVLGSTADLAFRKDQLRFNNAWYMMPLQQRVNINTAIIGRSLQKAIDNQNEAYAIQVASFAQSTFVTDKEAGLRKYENTMMEFYRETRDTARYFDLAMDYYNRYPMRIPVDSIKRVDSISLHKLLAATPARDSVTSSGVVHTTRNVKFFPTAQYYARDLAAGAQSFYDLSADPARWQTALAWARRSLEFLELPEAYDTYARLLYRLNRKPEALASEQRAIDMKKKRGLSAAEQETALAAMKKGEKL